MRLFLISGKAESGKDTTASFLYHELEGNNLIIHFADLLKFVTKTYLKWDGEKDKYGRSLLQEVGDKLREDNKDYFSDFVKDMLNKFGKRYDNIIIPDTRFLNEIGLNKDFETVTIRIVRPDHRNKLTPKQKNHKSETELDDYDFDIYLFNIGCLTYLHEEIKKKILNDYRNLAI